MGICPMVLFFIIVCFVEALEVKPIHVCMSADDNFTRQTVVALTSLYENGKETTFYHVNIMIPGKFGHKNRRRIDSLEKKYKNSKIYFIDMGNKYEDAPLRWVTTPTYYRLSAPSLFPDLEKCIYLDGDVIVRHDLSEMYDTNVDDYYIAGITEGAVYPKKQAEMKMKLLDMPGLKNYICAGVMIMNLKKMREDKVEEEFSKFIKEKGKYLKEIKFFYTDQDVINPVCYGKILPLPREFGLLVNLRKFYPDDFDKKDPIIVHFAGGPKPWHFPALSFFHKEWWSYAEKTTLYEKEIKMFDNCSSVKRKRRKWKKIEFKKLEVQKNAGKLRSFSKTRKLEDRV